VPRDHLPGRGQPAGISPVQHRPRRPFGHQASRAVLGLHHPAAHRAHPDPQLGRLRPVPGHHRHTRRVLRPGLAVQHQRRATVLVAGPDLLHVPPPGGQLVVVVPVQPAQQRRHRRLRLRRLDQKPDAGMRQQRHQVHLPPRRPAGRTGLAQHHTAAVDLGDGELLTVETDRQPWPQRRRPAGHAGLRSTDSPDSGRVRSVVSRPAHNSASSAGRAPCRGRSAASRSSASASCSPSCTHCQARSTCPAPTRAPSRRRSGSRQQDRMPSPDTMLCEHKTDSRDESRNYCSRHADFAHPVLMIIRNCSRIRGSYNGSAERGPARRPRRLSAA